MGNVSVLSRLPVLRILLPFVVGIILFRFVDSIFVPLALLVVAVVTLLWMRRSSMSIAKSVRARQFRIVPLSLVMVAVGWAAS